MSLRTPLGQAKGLGSAKSGTHHWVAARISAVALIPLLVWVIVGLIGISGEGYEAARAWVGHPVNAVALILFLVAGFHHAALGLQVVYEDYQTVEWIKIASILVTKLIAYALAAAGSFAVLMIAFGG